eukprot:EG_transcript_2045
MLTSDAPSAEERLGILHPNGCPGPPGTSPLKGWAGCRPSCNFVLSALICVLLAVEVGLYARFHNGVIRSSVQAFWHHFLPEGQEWGVAQFPDVDEAFAFLDRSVGAYYSLEGRLPSVFRHCMALHCVTPAPQLTFWYAETGDGPEDSVGACTLTLSDRLGPFGPCPAVFHGDCPCLPDLRERVLRFEVEFGVITTPLWIDLTGYETMLKCFQWRLRQVYDLSREAGLASVQLRWDYQECTGTLVSPERQFLLLGVWYTMLLVLLTAALLDLATRGVEFARRTHRVGPFPPCSAPLPGGGAGDFLPATSMGWLLWGMMADGLTVCFCLTFLVIFSSAGSSLITMLRWLFLGVAAMAQFILLSSFLEHDPRLFLLFNALSTAAPILGAFLLSSVPLLMSFALFGTAVFGMHSDTFSTVAQGMATLFAMLNGDSVIQTITRTSSGQTPAVALLAKLYFGAFLLLVLYVVGNISRVIIVQAYLQVSEGLPSLPPLSAAHPASRSGDFGHCGHCPSTSYHALWHRMKVFRVGLTLALCLLFTLQVAYTTTDQNQRIRETERTLKGLFLPTTNRDELDAQQAALYTVADTGAHLRHVADVYYRLNASTPAFYRHHASPGGTVPPPVLDLVYFTEDHYVPIEGINTSTTTVQCALLPGDATVGPLRSRRLSSDPCEYIPHLEQRIVRATLSFSFRTQPRASRACTEWQVAVTHDYSERAGVVPVTVRFEFMACDSPHLQPLLAPSQAGLMGLVLLVTICKLVLNIHRSYRVVLEASWRPYRLFTMSANLVWLTENTLYLAVLQQPEGLADLHRVLLGAVCCLNWILLVAHLETQPAHRHLGLTLRRALPVASRFVLGALPIFLGYCLFATVFFGHICRRFATVPESVVTLFGALNGDAVLDIHAALQDPNSLFIGPLASLFLYSFISLMMYGVLNIFLVITEEVYRAVAENPTPDPGQAGTPRQSRA